MMFVERVQELGVATVEGSYCGDPVDGDVGSHEDPRFP
jgi:hypothetical protein